MELAQYRAQGRALVLAAMKLSILQPQC